VTDLDYYVPASLPTDTVEYHLWSNDNLGNSMSMVAQNIVVVSELLEVKITEDRNDAAMCEGYISINKVANHNLYTLASMEHVSGGVSGCNISTEIGALNIDDLSFNGLGALVDSDDDGTLEFVQLMAGSGSSGGGVTSVALYNQFIMP